MAGARRPKVAREESRSSEGDKGEPVPWGWRMTGGVEGKGGW